MSASRTLNWILTILLIILIIIMSGVSIHASQDYAETIIFQDNG